jgi:mycothiol synthase
VNVERPTAPLLVVLRPPRPDEAAAVAEARNAYARRLWGRAETTPDVVTAAWGAPGVDPERDAVVAVVGEAIAGDGFLHDVAHGHRQFWLLVHVATPDERVELALFRRLAARARELAAPGAVIRASVAVHEEGRRRSLTEELGLHRVRHSFRMEIELDVEPPEPRWPAGITLRAYDPASDAEAVYELDMESFSGHWGFQREPFETWKHWMHRPPFDPDLWFLAVDGGRLVAFNQCLPPNEAEPEVAWVANLGVLPVWRRRGLGLALLQHALRVFRGREYRRAALGVDGENTTGAVGLYERAGMHVARHWEQYERALDV